MFCLSSDVPGWLKSLRLHKYGSLFAQLSYEDMLELEDGYLESKGVTKGARNKILLSIKKLKERGEVLQKLEKDVLQTGKLQNVLIELRQIVNTPIKPFNPPPGIPTTIANSSNASGVAAGASMEQPGAVNLPPLLEDLPAWITRVMGKESQISGLMESVFIGLYTDPCVLEQMMNIVVFIFICWIELSCLRLLLRIKNGVYILGNNSVRDWLDSNSLQEDQVHRTNLKGKKQ
ncbi:hypothetical protein QZH41_015688 [Actinostola sp. cb2023]|nr:hypothetical protein QZH41_015688 [Actinostola sp. cb2023]